MILRAPIPSRLLAGIALVILAGCGNDAPPKPEGPAPEVDEGEAQEPEVAEPATETGAEAPAEAARTAKPRPWPHESSDIPVDPRIQFGAFPNGLRYAWVDNDEPKKRCYIRLHVDVGSLGETDAERGMAHFLEHMAFNGSENYPAGTLIEWFQEHGMSFGADTNAHTSFSETVYKIDLPENDAETITDGLEVLRDFADGMLIASAEVEAEKGVIDGEQRERDSARFRQMEKELEIVFEGTLLAERLPIGTKEARDQFTAESVRAFYERWYRPENMTLVAVGDFGELDPVPLFEAAFGDMPVPATPLVKEPAPGKPKRFDHVYAIHEEEVQQIELSFGRMKAWEDEPVNKANMVADLPLNYARRMLNLRFAELAKKESAPFMSAGARRAAMLDVFDGEGVAITCAPDKWQAALAAGEQELRRALEHGFQQAELDELRADALRALDEAVKREETAPSRALLGSILSAAERPSVPTNAETRRSILEPAIAEMTIESCHAALKEAWAEGELSISCTGNLDLGETAEAQLRAAYEASSKVAVKAPEAKDTDAFAYASDAAKAGKIKSRNHVDDMDFDMITFENGVMLNVKRTDFRESQILISAQIGEGQLTADPKDVLALNMVAGAVMNGGGLAAHSVDDLRRLTAGKQVGVRFGVTPDRFVISGSATPEDLLMGCELACAHLQAPGWREDGVVQMRRQVPMMYQQMKYSHSGPLQQEFLPELFSGDPRYGMPSQEALMGTGVEEVRTWLEPLMADAPIELTLLGDLDVEATIQIVAQTFGTLPKRRAWRPYDERRKSPAPKAGLRKSYEIQTQVPKALVMIAFPTTDGIEMLRRRKLQMLSQVVNDRLRLEVREKLGAAYSPGAGAQSSTVNPGVGMLMMQAMADPDKVEVLVDACLAVADDLATKGATDAELDRLREPILNQRRDAKRTNQYWMNVMSRAQSDPKALDDVRAGDAFWSGVKAAEVNALAKEYLPSERASVVIVKPGTGGE